jgi:hypothetical protein
MKHKPKDSSRDEWTQAWNNSTYLLTPLYRLLLEKAKEKEQIKEDDFDSPNHHAKWAFREAKRQAYLEIIALLPPGCD